MTKRIQEKKILSPQETREAMLRLNEYDKRRRQIKDKQRIAWRLNSKAGKQLSKMGVPLHPYTKQEPEWYKDYLKTDHWKKKKAEYQQSSLPQECFVCGDPNYDLHHKSYDRIGAEHLVDLVPLCRGHHKATHKLIKKGSPMWSAHEQLKNKGN